MLVRAGLVHAADVTARILPLIPADRVRVAESGVAERDDEVVAWLSFSEFYGRPAYRRTAELSLYVDPAARACTP